MSLLPLIQSGKIILEEIITTVILPNLILFLCLYLGIKIITPLILKYNWKNQPASQYEIHVEVVEEGLIITTPVAESNLKWGIFQNWLETPNLFLVYQTKSCCNIFPKRAFSSEIEMNQFRDILREKVSPTQRN
ncbi:YcxB family protein [Calothrix sp. UHCC 0171]|uniref:YcxB family protein n=1 Tax=Calothrix sp. UHCC 0171 TaxID=3110245 RepID=UPI002B1EFCAA|nr:YcxB family protein [Calothrix sp. UHCC 0171]MEA5574681.1 YcxB family protein [Calothrix sp. UHCC 0171]